MSIRRNVQEQNRDTRREIQRIAETFRADLLRYSWLVEALVERGLDAHLGILIELTCIPEQEGDLYRGQWLTETERLFAFDVLVSRSDQDDPTVERWSDVTPETNFKHQNPGAGASFGAIALEVLHEIRR